MNIQIYSNKKNPDVLKAERFFKERRIPYQLLDLKTHKLGKRELELFVNAVGQRLWWSARARRRWNAPWRI
ncbi:MAG: hypothetical protein RR696_03390 [Clostridia bacterium]